MTLKLDTYVCNDCGAEIQAACFAEFKKKEREHKCKPISKRVARTNELRQQLVMENINDQAINAIERNKFDKLIQQGAVVCSQ